MEDEACAFVNRITIEGNTRTKDKVIRREVLVAAGDVFNTVRVDITKKRLENLGYFAKVKTYPEETDIPGRKDLTIQVQEKRTGSNIVCGAISPAGQLVRFTGSTQSNFELFHLPAMSTSCPQFLLPHQ